MLREISHEDYLQTLTSGIRNVTETTEPKVNIWPYVQLLVQENLVLPSVLEKRRVEKIYRTGDNNYEHIVLPSDEKDYFIVLVIDCNAKSVIGHHRLNLDKKYRSS